LNTPLTSALRQVHLDFLPLGFNGMVDEIAWHPGQKPLWIPKVFLENTFFTVPPP